MKARSFIAPIDARELIAQIRRRGVLIEAAIIGDTLFVGPLTDAEDAALALSRLAILELLRPALPDDPRTLLARQLRQLRRLGWHARARDLLESWHSSVALLSVLAGQPRRAAEREALRAVARQLEASP